MSYQYMGRHHMMSHIPGHWAGRQQTWFDIRSTVQRRTVDLMSNHGAS